MPPLSEVEPLQPLAGPNQKRGNENMKQLATFALVMLLGVPAAADTLIHAGRLIDGVSSKALGAHTIRVREDRIESVQPGLQQPGEGDTLVDLSDHTVMPGLMDMHVHLTGEYSPSSRLEAMTLDVADVAYRSVNYARATLEAGFTTVRNLGDRDDITIALRKAIDSGVITGPRIFTAGKTIGTTGGHADPSNGVKQALRGDPGPREGVINGSADAAKAVRQRYKDGADLIKITATGGVLSVARNGQNPQFTDEELAAIVAVAADYGFHVAAHAHGADGMKRAIRAGVRSIEHGTFMDKEAMALMKKNGTYYVPTIMAGKWVAEKARDDNFFPELVRPKAIEVGPQIQSTFAAAYREGVTIAFGTDSGVSPHGQNADEFVYMVEAGMPPMRAIQSATVVAAQLLGVEDDLGTLAAGKLADIVAVREDPLEDIGALAEMSFVMKEGRVYLRP